MINEQTILEVISTSLSLSLKDFSKEHKLSSYQSWDSFGVLSLIANIAFKFSIKLESNKLNELITFNDLIQYILSKSNEL